MKPNLFIGSSVENLEVADAIQTRLEHDCTSTVWNQGIFKLMGNALDDLAAALEQADFGVFVLTPNDITQLRDQKYQTTRVNVIFELGFFIGKLGKGRTFIILPRPREQFRLPTDLLGVNPAEYDASRDNIDAALGPACAEIRKCIKTLGVRSDRLTGPIIDKVIVKNVLCLATEPYELAKIEEDIGILEENFPGIVTIKRKASIKEFRNSIMTSKAQIMHIVVQIDPNTGAFRFPRKASLADESHPFDELPAKGFVQLVETVKPPLVVLPTCHAVYPAGMLIPITNLIAAAGDIPADIVVAWCEWFYSSLKAGKSLYKSFELAKEGTGANLVLFLRKDIVFAME